MKIAKREGPLRQKQVRKYLQTANIATELPDLLRDVPRVTGYVADVVLRTGLTPPTKVKRLPAPYSPDQADDPRDSEDAAWLASDLLQTRENNFKFKTFIQGHRARALRAKHVTKDVDEVVIDLPGRLQTEVEEYDRKVEVIRKRLNTAMDSEDEDWDESDLVF